MSRHRSCHRRIARGPIEAHAIYPVSVFVNRLGIGRVSLTALRKQGLELHPIGRRLFVDGGEAITFLRGLWQTDVEPLNPI